MDLPCTHIQFYMTLGPWFSVLVSASYDNSHDQFLGVIIPFLTMTVYMTSKIDYDAKTRTKNSKSKAHY